MANQWRSAATRWALAVALAGFGGNASAILLDRGPDMVYDDVLDITWTRQAGDGVSRGVGDAEVWAFGLALGGFDDWRLPFASVAAGFGPTGNTLTNGFPCSGAGGADEVACRDNEMAYMFYYNLDGNQNQNKTGTQTAVGGEELTGIGAHTGPTRSSIFSTIGSSSSVLVPRAMTSTATPTSHGLCAMAMCATRERLL